VLRGRSVLPLRHFNDCDGLWAFAGISLNHALCTTIMANRRCNMVNAKKCSRCGRAVLYVLDPSLESDPFYSDIGAKVSCEHCGEINYLLGTAIPTSFRFSRVSALDRGYTVRLAHHKNIADIHNAFISNLDRVLAFGKLPQLFRFHFEKFLKHYKVVSRSHGIVPRSGVTIDRRHVSRITARSADRAIAFVPNRAVLTGLEGLLSAMLTGTWTAFETLAGDLWETALNLHPKGLANLDGSASRITGKAKDRRRRSRHIIETGGGGDDSKIKKQIELRKFSEATDGTFNLGTQMGSYHRTHSNVAFDSLWAIRAAYSCAFNKRRTAVDDALSDPSLDVLSLVRNVLVHRSGVVDDKYLLAVRNVRNAPRAALNAPLSFNGDRVAKLIKPVIATSLKLISAVDAEVMR
jgi:hypothetical protein